MTTGVKANYGEEPDDDMQVIAHRGLPNKYPGNTMPSLEEGMEYADAIELDVRTTADDELVVYHDEDLEQVGEGYDLAEVDWEYVSELDKDGEQIPRLEDVLRELDEGQIWLETKERVVEEVDEAIEEAEQKYDSVPDISFHSFNPADIEDANQLGYETALINWMYDEENDETRDLSDIDVEPDHYTLATGLASDPYQHVRETLEQVEEISDENDVYLYVSGPEAGEFDVLEMIDEIEEYDIAGIGTDEAAAVSEHRKTPATAD